jgi:GTP-binding protein
MLLKKTKFLASCANWTQWPGPTHLPIIGFWGRSNVGKSSLLNAIIATKLAHVSKTPGRTRLLNLFQNENPDCVLCDLPGYGYANLSKTEGAEIATRLEKYLLSPRAPNLLCWLVDSRHGLTKTDLMIAPLITELSLTRDILVISTKNDKLTKSEQAKNKETLLIQLDQINCMAQVLPFSCSSKDSIHQFNAILEQFLNAYSQQEPTQ